MLLVCSTGMLYESVRFSRAAEKKRKETTTPFGVNFMRSQVIYRAAQGRAADMSVEHSKERLPKLLLSQKQRLKLAVVLHGSQEPNMLAVE